MMTDATRRTPGREIIDLAHMAWRAGEIILRHYADSAIVARSKEDHSPVTSADEEAEAYILDRLRAAQPGLVPTAQ